MINTERFTGRVEVYDRFRQRYPTAEILARLRGWCGLQPDLIIADIGAGTGMLSEVFLDNGNPVVAIEPNAEMHLACARLRDIYPQLTVLDGSAESTGLPGASIDIVAAGRAFHWFDIPRALAEFERILKPDGWLVLVSLGRAKNATPQSVDFEDLLTTRGVDHTYVRAGYRVHDKLQDIFTTDLHQTQIPGAQQLDWESFLGQTMSFSTIPTPDDPRFGAFTQRLREHFDTYAVDGVITVATTCWIAAGRISTR
jgi:ubiquinone/menaquinone biosynthesis C-methylase UbiE